MRMSHINRCRPQLTVLYEGATLMRKLSLIATILILLGVGATVTVAQEEDTPRPVGTHPIGEALTVYDSDGEEAAQITATEFTDPFEDYSEFSEPDRNERFVFFAVEVGNTGERPYEFQPYNFSVLDAQGILYSVGFIVRTDQSTVDLPDLEEANMLPDESLAGGIGFRVPADAELTQLVYTFYDENQHLYLVANLADEPAEADE